MLSRQRHDAINPAPHKPEQFRRWDNPRRKASIEDVRGKMRNYQ
jgi:hypothetical protein